MLWTPVLYIGRVRVVRKTNALVRIAVALMSDPLSQHWGYQVMTQAHVRSGVLYPIFQRMLDENWLTDGWEDPATIEKKRPPRRYYELTDKGRRELGAILNDADVKLRFGSIIPTEATS